MKPIRIDKSRVPADQLNRRELLKFEQQLFKHFSKKENREADCIHEAGHEFYYRLIGMAVTRKGPGAIYRPLTNDFIFGSLETIAVDTPQTKRNVMDTAKALAAGGVAKVTLSPNTDPCDGHDFTVFNSLCKERWPNMIGQELQDIWDRAKDLVREDLCSQELQDEIRKIAREIENEIFG